MGKYRENFCVGPNQVFLQILCKKFYIFYIFLHNYSKKRFYVGMIFHIF